MHVHIARGHERHAVQGAQVLQVRQLSAVIAFAQQLDRDPQRAREVRGEPREFLRTRHRCGDPQDEALLQLRRRHLGAAQAVGALLRLAAAAGVRHPGGG